VTQHHPETYDYLIDTAFIAVTALLGLAINFILLRAAFAPLNTVMRTIRAVEHGEWSARVAARETDADTLALARAFNSMLDRLEQEHLDAAARVLRAGRRAPPPGAGAAR
jgi:nitrogen fixation/metabolism regulation signal transduction histidine kinase